MTMHVDNDLHRNVRRDAFHVYLGVSRFYRPAMDLFAHIRRVALRAKGVMTLGMEVLKEADHIPDMWIGSLYVGSYAFYLDPIDGIRRRNTQQIRWTAVDENDREIWW